MTSPTFADDFADLSAIGATPAGGVERQAATDAHVDATRWFMAACRDRGFEVRVDAVGNVYGLSTWAEGAPYVLVGSHLDSQPRAGRFDGAYGVIAALHAAHAVAERVTAGSVVPARNIAVVSWFNEEGSRFKPSMMGSGVYAGLRDRDAVLATTDPQGVSVREALQAGGIAGGDDAPAAVGYAEIHIEQGRRLDSAGADIGIVTRNWCVRKYHLVVEGEQSHTGATLLSDRRDALAAAAQIIVSARDIVEAREEGRALCAVGELNVTPNVAGVIAREAELFLDLRADGSELLDELHEEVVAMLRGVSDRYAVAVDTRSQDPRTTVSFGRPEIELAGEVVADAGLSALELPTMAGHDSINLVRRVPTSMLFVPSLHGISHNEREESTMPALERGVDVLTGVVSRMVEGAGTADEHALHVPQQLTAAAVLP